MAAKRVRPIRALGRMAGFSLIELVIVIVILRADASVFIL